ncbi:hypothetical protein ACIB24_00275 [Spongisporangium articulatum]|uniref:Uncharacterized protein n=1 Tax=Spongisporangium articulatum TaxID=3362603 RepID=A0ABW8AGK1_9ACTN
MKIDITNVVTLGVSLTALALSTLLAARQAGAQERANMAVISDLNLHGQQREWHEAFYFVTMELEATHSPERGVRALPAPAQDAVYRVLYYFHGIALMVKLGVLKDPRILDIYHHRVLFAWKRLEPFVKAERLQNPAAGKNWMKSLEEFYGILVEREPYVRRRLFARWRRSGFHVPIGASADVSRDQSVDPDPREDE